MVNPLLILGGLVAGGVATVVAIKKKKDKEVPPGIANKIAKGTPQDLVAGAVALAQQKIAAGLPPGEAAKVASDAVASLAPTVSSKWASLDPAILNAAASAPIGPK